MPVSQYREKIEYIKMLTNGSILACLILGGIIAAFLARKNYNPVREIISYVKRVQTQEDARIAEDPNEFIFIRDFIHNTQKDKEKYYAGWKKYSANIRNNFLNRLLKGEINEDISVDAVLENYHITFDSAYFAVLLINIEDYSRLFDKKEYDSISMVKFAILNVMEEISNQNLRGLVIDCGDVMACLINLNGNDAACEREIDRICNASKDLFEEELGVFITISVSSIVKNEDRIPDAYQEAVEAMEYRAILGNNLVIRYENIKPTQSRYPFSFDAQRKLINCIRAGEYEDASKDLDMAFDDCVLRDGIPIEMARCMVFGFINTMVQAIDEDINADDTNLMNTLRSMEQMTQCKTLVDMKEELKKPLKDFCELKCRGGKKSKNAELRDEIIQYVKDHYMDTNIGVAGIAEAFNMNSLYISRYFKEQEGEALPDYITKVRLEKAKELIRQGSTVQKVACDVGYVNVNSFIRIFKKFEGITPGKLLTSD